MKKRKDGLYQLTETIEIYGKKKRKTFYGKTVQEAKRKRDEFIRSQNPDEITFGDAFKLFEKFEEPRISVAAWKTKNERIKAFGNIFLVKLNAVTPQMIAVEINKLAIRNPKTHKPTAKRTLTRYLAAVSNVFEFAESERITQYNPCKFVKIPSNAPQRERDALLPIEYNVILSHTEIDYLAPQIMILCGLRRGELTALTYGDISDFINVNKSFDFKGNTLKLPKTKSGIRQVPIPEKLKKILFDLKKKHKDTDYVIGGKKMYTENDWQQLRKNLIKELGFDFTWHQLRHTYATILYDSGVDVLSAQKFLGHSDIKVTLGIYTSLSEKRQEKSIENLNKFLA